MRKFLLAISLASLSFALDFGGWDSWGEKRPYKDYWGNSYKNYENMWKDSDGDGIINYYDYNDRNPNIWHPSQKKYRWRW